MKAARIEKAYKMAVDRYGEQGVNVKAALERLRRFSISLHCWQGDDVRGFENTGSASDGGLVATGNYPGRARNAEELRRDIEQALRLVPGKHRVNLHAIYAETERRKVDRNELEYAHFERWTAWAKKIGVGVDFNPSFFAHPKAASGFTLSSPDKAVRKFWIEHGIACRRIGERIGRELGSPCVTNVWIPDGWKDVPVDRKGPRERLEQSLDEIFAREANPRHNLDSVESKLFGIGTESYVVGSHEFYMGYAMRNGKLLCLDTGHFHPTESVADKIASLLVFLNGILLHVSRGIRWDSDHVVVLSDEIRSLAEEITRGGYDERVRIGLDYFDASINRIAAWVIGMRAMLKALLAALLDPVAELRRLEERGDLTGRLALLEEAKNMPISAVWDYWCLENDVPVGMEWLAEVRNYEKKVLSKRG